MADDNLIRSELLSIRQQEFGPWLPEQELRALNRRATLLIKKAGLWGMAPDAYERWLEGDTVAAAGPIQERAAPTPVATAKPSPAGRSHEFADLDRTAAPSSGMTRRARGNALGSPATQAAIDDMWSGITAKLNATRQPMPAASARRAPTPADASPAPLVRQSQASINDMWADIARRGNAEAGLRMPARGHVR